MWRRWDFGREPPAAPGCANSDAYADADDNPRSADQLAGPSWDQDWLERPDWRAKVRRWASCGAAGSSNLVHRQGVPCIPRPQLYFERPRRNLAVGRVEPGNFESGDHVGLDP